LIVDKLYCKMCLLKVQWGMGVYGVNGKFTPFKSCINYKKYMKFCSVVSEKLH